MKSADMPAMPLGDGAVHLGSANPSAIGLTKREHFAAIAMQGLCGAAWTEDWTLKEVATSAISHADALLAELERTS